VIAARTDAAVVHVHTMSDLRAPDDDAMPISSVSGDGVDELRAHVNAILVERHPRPPAATPVITRARHEAALAASYAELDAFLAAWRAGGLPATVAATHVRAAVHSLDELIGAVHTEDVLGRVFSRFCVGK
jgi:tRNA modification GTPase